MATENKVMDIQKRMEEITNILKEIERKVDLVQIKAQDSYELAEK